MAIVSSAGERYNRNQMEGGSKRSIIDTRIEFALMMFPQKVSMAALSYIQLVGSIALGEVELPGIIDPTQIVLSDMPVTPRQKEAHKKLLNHVAIRLGVSPVELLIAKEAILNACDPLAHED